MRSLENHRVTLAQVVAVLVYGVAYGYLLTAAMNFFTKIAVLHSVVILAIALILSAVSAAKHPLETIALPMAEDATSRKVTWGLLYITFVWVLIVGSVPTTSVDANIYHLPLALLINESLWYPGVGKLSSHFGFPNGTSVLGSLFTSFGMPGLENIPNVIIWSIFALGIFLYLERNGINRSTGLAASLLFCFTPRLFLESYNIGTDLPLTCFLTLGLLAAYEKRPDDAFLFFALSTVFKSLGMVAAFLVIPYVVKAVWTVGDRRVSKLKFVLAILLLVLSTMRIYIATGNPVYPAMPLNVAPWGIDIRTQSGLIHGEGSVGTHLTTAGLRHYTGVERSPSGVMQFIINFTLRPYLVKSEHWFWPFLLGCALVSIRRIFKTRNYRDHFDATSIYVYGICVILTIAWFYYSPIFRFIAGVLVFVNLSLFVFAYRSPRLFHETIVVHLALYVTLALFLANVMQRVSTDIIPFLASSDRSDNRLMPWRRPNSESTFSIVRTVDGFLYSRSNSNYCHRLPPPCINARSIGAEETLVLEFRRYNGV